MTLIGEDEIDARLAQLTGWRRAKGEVAAIECDRDFADFAAALRFVNDVGRLAEDANHHPDILLHGWNSVRLTLSTHSERGVTDADFELAERIAGLD